MRNAGINTIGTIFNKSMQILAILAYTDNIVLVGKNQHAISESLKLLEEVVYVMSLRINKDKINMIFSAKKRN